MILQPFYNILYTGTLPLKSANITFPCRPGDRIRGAMYLFLTGLFHLVKTFDLFMWRMEQHFLVGSFKPITGHHINECPKITPEEEWTRFSGCSSKVLSGIFPYHSISAIVLGER